MAPHRPSVLRSRHQGADLESQPSSAGPARRVLLVCPPYQDTRVSPLAIPLLATLLRAGGIPCGEVYLHFALARRVGSDHYRRIVHGGRALHGELLFAEGLHGDELPAEARATLAELFGTEIERDATRRDLERRLLEQVHGSRPDVVGFTTSLNQLVPALWCARVIKRAFPDVQLVLGGSACSEPMGPRILEGYPEVDCVVSGYGERALLSLARGELPRRGLIRSTEAVHLDALPIPEYDGFLEQAGDFDPRLMLSFESSRGCWWGQKQHCTFCGLNGVEMAFNAKSTARVVAEIHALWERHHRNLFATDAILSRAHLKEVIPELAGFESRPGLFYEVKANMTEAEVIALRRANVLAIQPGIESLSSRLLKLLRKGVDAIQNLALLKWCREQDVAVGYNQLYAIPGESDADYDAQIALMRRIPHFPPPERMNPVRLDRYSPYFEQHREYGWSAVEPFAEYRLLHPHLDEAGLAEIAYHFHGVGGAPAPNYAPRFADALREWHARNQQGEGLFLDPVQGLVRNGKERGFRFQMSPTLARILECTHQIAPIARVLDHARCDRALLDRLVAEGVLYIERDRVLNLSVRTAP